MELAQWLLDRIAEDEADADRWHESDCASCMGPPGPFPCTCNGPARVLAECASKRAIVELHEPTATGWNEVDGEPSRYCTRCHHAWPCADLRLLAAVYADRDGYDPAWAPE